VKGLFFFDDGITLVTERASNVFVGIAFDHRMTKSAESSTEGEAMGLLWDKELSKAVEAGLVKGISSNEYKGAEDPIQASSIDLHVGKIYVPDDKEEADGSSRIREDYCLEQGHTVMLETEEKLELPANIAAIGFPPSRVSIKGILMTNPGHVDPGYKGHMRFTVINMGKEAYGLKKGMSIVTVLFFRMDGSAEHNWLSRRGGEADPQDVKDSLRRLSVDFLDVTKRANDAALKLSGWISGGAVILAAIVAAVIQWIALDKNTDKKFVEMEARIKVIETKAEIAPKVQKLESRIELLEQGQRVDRPNMKPGLSGRAPQTNPNSSK